MTQKQNEQALDERMARLLGYSYAMNAWWTPGPDAVLAAHLPDFATDHNAIHNHVIPYLKERGLMEKWAERVVELQASKVFKTHARQCGNIVKGAVIMSEADAATRTLAAAQVAKEHNERSER